MGRPAYRCTGNFGERRQRYSWPVEWSTLVAGCAAGVSTIVGLRQIMVDLPSVRISVFRDARLLPQGTPVMVIDVINAGRRPVFINMVGYLESGATFLGN